MKLSNRFRWALVLPTIIAAFFAEGFVLVQIQPILQGDWEVAPLIFLALTAGIMVAPLHGKRFVIVTAVLLIFTSLFPPWRHFDKPAGYAFLLTPPSGDRIQIDFGRLFLEWVALAAGIGLVWLLVIKPASPPRSALQ